MKRNTTLKEIAALVEGQLQGDPDFTVSAVNSLHKAAKDEITFSVKDGIDTAELNAGALVVNRKSKLDYPNLIRVDEPYIAFAKLLEYFFPHKRFNREIAANAYIAGDACIGEGVSIGPSSYVGENSIIGDNCEIHANVSIYRDVKIGRNCLIYSNVVIREEVEIGDNVILQPGVVIGADGFGFTRLQDGTPVKVPQKGKVIIGSNCEIGANTCIDRSTVEETELADYVKLDNLVQVGHNVRIGKYTAISSQTGISGSVTIGENVVMGGQVGLADHLSIADGVMMAAKTGVSGNVTKRSIIAGIPHQEMRKWRKNYAIFRNMEDYVERIKALEQKIKVIDKTNDIETEET
ncbi:MAG: UDP-3-O-(3-hydroxymyristoyl)glucosamine N-acyltransferase [bacterium]|nr:UDP-3-O-(3-hydroxymyristoyl)glucosamine N-acyltransferase [bacterium]